MEKIAVSERGRRQRRGAPAPAIQVGSRQEREWPGSSALATDCVLNLVNFASRVLAYGLEHVVVRGVPSVAAFNVLTILQGEGGPLLPSMIAERMIVTRGTMTGVLGSLERRGLVRRSPHSRDGRMRPVEVTSEGIAKVEEILPLLHDVERRWMDALTSTQQRQLLRLVATIQTAGPDRERGS